MSATDRLVERNTLSAQDTAHLPGVECQVKEAAYADDITRVDTRTVGYHALDPTDDTAAHDHHDEEIGSLVRAFAQSADGKGKE